MNRSWYAMLYRTNPQNRDKLSILGFGCMRFVKDEAKLEQQIIYAIENGVNYFDTAYIYPNSEERLGRVLAKGYRKRVCVATKLPPYLVSKYEDFDKLLNTQLRRLQTDYIDYYFIHMLPDVKEWNRLCGLGILDWIDEKKKLGQIINIGFSYHGGVQEFKKLIDEYAWGFCMLQYNYLDENNQAGKIGLQYAASKGMAVMIMEPLRGGRLAGRLPKEAADIFEQASDSRSTAEWGLRWVWNHPEVTTLLSGMNTMEMIEENIRIASNAMPDSLSDHELELYRKARKVILGKSAVPCTGCNYCMPCPHGVDIPMCFSCYNDSITQMAGTLKCQFYYVFRTNNHNASLCTGCGKCEKHCPQSIAIRDTLADVVNKMEGPLYCPFRFAVKKFMKI